MPTSAETSALGAEYLVVRAAVPPSTCSTWLALIDDVYLRNEVVRNPDFVQESSSLRLGAVGGLSDIDVWNAVDGQVHTRCREFLRSRPAIDVDQCWVRRQYSPQFAPPRHHPHSWHQDGALGFEFARWSDAATPDDALLPMVTCWIALTPCGVDAPGIELVTDHIGRLVPPAQLVDDVVGERWPAPRRVRPALAAGDALVFDGAVLHRTHVSAAMTRLRTSIELRLFRSDAIPDRLADDQFVTVPSSQEVMRS